MRIKNDLMKTYDCYLTNLNNLEKFKELYDSWDVLDSEVLDMLDPLYSLLENRVEDSVQDCYGCDNDEDYDMAPVVIEDDPMGGDKFWPMTA